MSPTLKTGDSLKILPYRNRAINVGDVIVFPSPYDDSLIVHRVVSVDKQGIQTKGDNSRFRDNVVLQLSAIIGQVVSVQRNGRKISISGGFPGQMYALALWAAKCADHALITVIRRFYIWLAEQGIFRKVFPNLSRLQIYCFKTREGMELKLRLGRRVVGRRLPGHDRWYIRRPFRLFIDESSLPKPNGLEGKQKASGAQGIEQRVKG
jgi:signal peptidase